ncbi:MAG: hypothetical protein R3F37_23145 [Candidatus Competibacteraceae bacterium]
MAIKAAIFSCGRPDPAHDFGVANMFESHDTALMDALIRVLTLTGNESIEFHACNVGGVPVECAASENQRGS